MHQSSAPAPAMVEAQDLRKSYSDVKAVDGVSFRVEAGETFGILGPNGAGKTTTVEILEAMRRPDSGQAWVNGIDVVNEPRRVKSFIGVQLQAASFFDQLKLAELLELFASFYGRTVDPLAVLRAVELEEKARSYFPKLSGGQKQRFSIATSLVHDPPLLFLDEPTTGLDPQARRHMWDLVRGFQAKGKTIVLTTHYMEEAETLCHRVAIMDRGRIIALERPEALIDRLLAKGFKKEHTERQANLEDVFLDLTGRALREE